MKCLDSQAIVFKQEVPRQSSVAGKAVIRAAASHPASCSGRITRHTQFAARARTRQRHTPRTFDLVTPRSEECNGDSTLEHSGWWAGSLMDGRLQFGSHGWSPVSSSVSFKCIRFVPIQMRSEQADAVQICTIDFKIEALNIDGAVATNPLCMDGAVATNPGGCHRNFRNFPEGPQRAIDGSVETKWFDTNKSPLVITFPQPVRVDAFCFVTANDMPERDPVSWTVEGSQDALTWTVIHSQSGYSTPECRHARTDWFPLRLSVRPPEDVVEDIVVAPRTLPPSAPRTRLLLWTCRHPHGLFSCFNIALGYAKRCLCPWRPGLVLDLYVDWSSEEMLYRGPHGEPNLWQAFFRQPASLRMKAEDLNAALSNKDYVNTFEAGFVEHETECFSWRGVTQDNGMGRGGPIPFDVAARGRDLCQRMICLKDEFKHEVEQASQRLLGKEHRWLAVHIRRTDKAIEARANLEVSDEFCMLRITNQCRHWQCDGVFLCSDDPHLKELLKDRLSADGLAVSVYPATLSRREGTEPNSYLGTHFDTDLDSYKKAEDVMTEVLLMAKSCHGLLSTFSNVSAAVVYLSPHSYPYATFWDPVSANSIWEWKRHRNNLSHLPLTPGSGSTHAEFLGTANSVAEAEELAAARPTHFKSLVWVRPDYADPRWARMVYGIVASAPTFAPLSQALTQDEVKFGRAAPGVDSAALFLT